MGSGHMEVEARLGFEDVVIGKWKGKSDLWKHGLEVEISGWKCGSNRREWWL